MAILIPLSIAMMPVGLSALLLCVCFCGPKESRGKLPDVFRKSGKIGEKDASEIDNKELTCKDGVVMRKDSKRTRFSTTISFIEANDQTTEDDQSITSDHPLFAIPNENAETATIMNSNNNNNNNDAQQILMNAKNMGKQE
ncbi:unnamed protein product [Litomosoides sigmodontis]|uniref:Uncharacterized protein n=1 Tax=Litomosoides sigmodontis TaxID=42156 RepID=A0A3P6TE48_LITSI|nr:unnamed protein product [Litomosoides sigmodontis]